MQHEAEPHSRHAASGVRLHGLALLAALVLAPGGVGAQTSPAVCTPTQTVSAQPDANGIYTTTLTCADTSATAGAADYRHLHYNQGPGTSAHPNSEDRDSGLPNNNENNNVALTVGRGVVFTADGYVDLRELPIDAAIALWRGGAKTVVIEDGAVINLKRTPGSTSAPSGWYTYPDDSLRRLAGIYVDSQTNKGDITVRHHGVININIDVQGPYDANNGAAIWAVVEDLDGSAARADDDILIEVGPTGVIRHVEGTDGFGGIEAVNSAEDGDVTINLAKGSLVDIASAGGAVAVYAAIFPNGLNAGALTGNIDINAAGTIRAAVKRTTPSLGQGVGIWATHRGDGRVRVASSGTVETWQANAIYASSWGSTSPHHDDPATEEIEGHLIDVTGGKVHTRGGTAISASTASEDAAFTVRVAEGALVRAELDAGPDAITQEQLGGTGNGYVNLPSVYGWRQIDTNGDDTNDAIEPIINAIAVRRSATRTEGVVDRVLVHGTVETVGGKQDVDPAVWLERGGQVMVGATGRVSADSGLAISSGTSPAEGADPTTSDLDVTVAGMVTGDIRVLDDGALTATVSGTVDGDIRGMGDGDHTVAVQRGGTVTGTVHLAGSTVTVGGTVGSIILDNSGMVMVAPTGRVTGVPNGGHGVRVGANGRIENRGTIEGKIGIRAGPGSTVVNFGTVRSTDEAAGVAIDFPEAGTNTLTLKQGTIIDGKIRGLAGDDTVDLSDLEVNEVGTLTFVDETGTPVTPASIMRPMRGTGRLIEVGNSLVAFPTAFALADDVLSDLTGSIHAAVVDSGHVPGTRPAAGHVWATPFGGARDQNGDGRVLADATHYFGGGLLGAGWGGDALHVGGFIGGSTGRLAVDNVQDVDVQTVFGGVYAQQAMGDVRLDARLLIGHMSHDSARRLGSRTAEVEYTSVFVSPEVGVATALPLTTTLSVTPRLRVRYAGLFTEGFREQTAGLDLQVAKRDVHLLEARGEVGVPIPMEGGGQFEPRVGFEGRWLLAGETVQVSVPGGTGTSRVSAGGDRVVGTGTVGFGVTLPLEEALALVGSFDGALTTEHAWRARGYMGLQYSF